MATETPLVYKTNNGDKQVVASGGIIDIETGGALKFNAVDVTSALAAAIATPVAGVAAGYKVARVEMALDGSNPTAWATGLTTVIAACVTLKGSAAPGAGTSVLTAVISSATVNVYAWKPTTGGAAGNADLVASTGTESFYGIAIGT